MDKEEFLKILESTSCHNINNYVYDREWSLLSGLSYSEDKKKWFKSNLTKEENLKENESQTNKKEKNILKILEYYSLIINHQ